MADKTINHVEMNTRFTDRGILEVGIFQSCKISKHGKSDIRARESRVKYFMDDRGYGKLTKNGKRQIT